MSLSQVLTTLTGALQDSATGLAPKAAALATLAGFADGYIPADVHYEQWMLSGMMHTAGQPNIAIAPAQAQANQIPFVGSLRDSRHGIQVSFETFAADAQVIQDTVLTISEALLQVLDGIEAYSHAHSGTIEALQDPIMITFGTFTGPATTSGFTATFTVLERSPR